MRISKVIFYTKDFDKKINSLVDIILSPEFYWIKEINVPIKNIFQAKKIAKHLFDLDGEYFYDAFKIDDKYYAVAIDKNLALKIDKKYIKSLHLAQKELYKYDCIKINDNCILRKIGNILFCFREEGNECKDINDIFKEINLSSYTLNLNAINLEKKYLFLGIVSFSFIILYFLIGGILYKKESNLIENKKNLLSKYNLPLNTFQLNAIYNELKNIDNKNQKIKKDLEIISFTPLKKDEEFIQISFDKNFFVKIKTSRNLDNYFKKYFKVTSKFDNKIYSAKLKDE